MNTTGTGVLNASINLKLARYFDTHHYFAVMTHATFAYLGNCYKFLRYS